MKVNRVEKPWGYELLLACTQAYAGKILCIRAGQRLSLQHHQMKDETLFLLKGETELELGGPGLLKQRMAPDESYRVRAGQRHRLTALTDAAVLEVSTPELDDVVRWEDDYGRADPSQSEDPLLILPADPSEGRSGSGALPATGSFRCAFAPEGWPGTASRFAESAKR